MRSIRITDSGLESARWNVAVTAAQVELHRAGRIPDTLRFYRHPRSVLIGRGQALDRDVRFDHIPRTGVEFARRMTDGDVTCANPGMLAFDFIADRRSVDPRLGRTAERLYAGVAGGLRRLGLPARLRPPVDIEIDRQTVSTTSSYIEGPTLLFQATMLVDTDAEKMGETLAPTNGRRTDRVASVAKFLGRSPLADEVKDVLIAEFAIALRSAPIRDMLSDEEHVLSGRLLAEKIGTDGFVFGEDLEQRKQSGRSRFA
jgi:lipoate---protein ligase